MRTDATLYLLVVVGSIPWLVDWWVGGGEACCSPRQVISMDFTHLLGLYACDIVRVEVILLRFTILVEFIRYIDICIILHYNMYYFHFTLQETCSTRTVKH